MDQRTRRTALITATALVWSTALAVGVGRFKLAAKGSVTVSLLVRPATVHVSVDGERIEGGAWIETPRKLQLAPGRHRLKISRDGYIAHLVTVDGDPGLPVRMEDVVLERSGSTPAATVDVSTVVPGDPPLYIEIDDGFVRGETPLSASDVVAELPHTLTVYPRWPDKGGAVRCRFSARPTPEGDEAAVHKILLRTVNGRVKFNGCERPNAGGGTPRRK